jgi:hypothetical protein
MNVTPEVIKAKFQAIRLKRDSLLHLSQQDNLGNLKIDAIQALEEMDDLIEDFRRTFPE